MPVGALIERGCIYKITYPNGKVYIGQDRTDDINYFGSADSSVISRDFSRAERSYMVIQKEILWDKKLTTIQELNREEAIFIRFFKSNQEQVGYNRTLRGKR